jgi:hypothetical protein
MNLLLSRLAEMKSLNFNLVVDSAVDRGMHGYTAAKVIHDTFDQKPKPLHTLPSFCGTWSQPTNAAYN